MSETWLAGAKWSDWTREERYFCAVLFRYADANPDEFAQWVIQTAELDDPKLPTSGWEVGYEVCFYRDYLWERGELKGTKLPLKRTFDLCLIAPGAVIVIEAKAFEGFSRKQNAEFKKDCDHLRDILGSGMEVRLVALATSAYVANRRVAKNRTLAVFDGRALTWKAAAEEYEDHRLRVADELYGRKPGGVAKRGVASAKHS